MSWLRWSEAMEGALYGPNGFFRSAEGPAGHFRTSVHASALFARAVLALLRAVDRELERPAALDVVDVGAGRGELLVALLAQAEAADPELARRLRPHAVERAARPDGLPARMTWADEMPSGAVGLLLANEWLDNVPLDVAEVDEDGVARWVEVAAETGEERLGAAVAGADAAWLDRWWPLAGAEPGCRAEIGRPRDAAWAGAVGCLDRGLAVAVDYAHHAGERPPFGTLAAFRQGREVRPVPDGSCDLTCHVALDACLEAVSRECDDSVHSLWTTQRIALRALGVSGARPPLAMASTDPAGYVRALAAAGEAAELTDPGGLGGFGWAVQTVRMPVPSVLAGVPGWETLT